MSSERRPPRLGLVIDVGLAAVVFLVEYGPVLADAPPWHVRPFEPIDALRLAGISVPLLVRRRFPLTVLGVVVASFVGSEFLGPGLVPAFYSAGAWSEHVWRSRGAAVAGAIAVVASFVAFRGVEIPFEALVPFAVFGGAWYIGDVSRLRRRYVITLEEHARRLETAHAEEHAAIERAAAVGERARIARDLHDIVAHRVSMITVQAGAARTVADTDPDALRRAVTLIEEAGRKTLWELRRLVGVLRATDDTDPLGPQPTLDSLDDLVAEMEHAGVPVRLTVMTDTVPPAIAVSVHRIVQEALTNVIKHAGIGAEVDVIVRSEATDLVVEVLDTGAATVERRLPGGHGLAGMRERAAVFGGHVEAGPRAEGGFAVRARIPMAGASA